MRTITYVFSGYFFINGLYLLAFPMQFYTNTPGVASMGPFNAHFVTDVSFAFFAAGVGLAWGAYRRVRSTAIVGASWPFLHALFHLQIWVKRDLALDAITVSDFIAVIVPGILAMLVAAKINRVEL